VPIKHKTHFEKKNHQSLFTWEMQGLPWKPSSISFNKVKYSKIWFPNRPTSVTVKSHQLFAFLNFFFLNFFFWWFEDCFSRAFLHFLAKEYWTNLFNLCCTRVGVNSLTLNWLTFTGGYNQFSKCWFWPTKKQIFSLYMDFKKQRKKKTKTIWTSK